jgi:hypothetical protein
MIVRRLMRSNGLYVGNRVNAGDAWQASVDSKRNLVIGHGARAAERWNGTRDRDDAIRGTASAGERIVSDGSRR